MIQNEICMQIRDFCSYLTPQGDLETWLVCYERFMCTRLKMCLILPPNIFFPLKVVVLWYAAPFSLLRIDRRFRHAYWLRHQTDKLLWNVGRCQTSCPDCPDRRQTSCKCVLRTGTNSLSMIVSFLHSRYSIWKQSGTIYQQRRNLKTRTRCLCGQNNGDR